MEWKKVFTVIDTGGYVVSSEDVKKWLAGSRSTWEKPV
jgi:hypothetical protein